MEGVLVAGAQLAECDDEVRIASRCMQGRRWADADGGERAGDAGELVKSILPKLRDCLFSADRELAMYAARTINRLTGVGETGGPQRAVLVSGKAVGEGGDAEVFLEALCVLLLSAENEYDIANITGAPTLPLTRLLPESMRGRR